MKKTYVVKAVKNPKNALYVVRVNVDAYLGKKIFKNTAGFVHNLQGKFTSLKTKKESKNLSHPKASDLIINGYATLGKPFNPKIFEKIVEKYNDLIEDDKHSSVRSEYDGTVYSRMINQVYKKIPEISELLSDELLRIIKQYYKGNFEIHHVFAWRNRHIPPEIVAKKELFSSHWHCDGRDTSRLTLFINLSNVTEEHGPLHVQSKQRTKELIKMGWGNRHNYKLSPEVVEEPKHVVKNIGTSGTAIICNSQICLHRAGLPSSGKIRDMLELRFKPSNVPLPNDWIDHIREENIGK